MRPRRDAMQPVPPLFHSYSLLPNPFFARPGLRVPALPYARIPNMGIAEA